MGDCQVQVIETSLYNRHAVEKAVSYSTKHISGSLPVVLSLGLWFGTAQLVGQI